MLVVTNQVLPSVTISNSKCYDTTHQHFHFARGLLDFWGLVVTNFGFITRLNTNLRKLETAYLSRFRGVNNGADFGAQTPPGRGVSVGNSYGTHPDMQKPSKTGFRSKKRGAEK